MVTTNGYFAADGAARRVSRELALLLGGGRALLLQVAHPLVAAGVAEHSGYRENPWKRLEGTMNAVWAIVFGTRAQADRAARRVRAMHGKVRGNLPEAMGRYPAGTPYRADDPELLLWILFTLVDSGIVVYRRYVGPMSRDEEAAYWEDYRVVGRLFGLRKRDMPATLDDLDAYRRRMLEGDELHVTPWARQRAREIVLEPPVPRVARPLVEAVNFTTIALLPDRIRREYGFGALPPAFVRKAVVRGASEYTKRLVMPLLPGRIRLVPR